MPRSKSVTIKDVAQRAGVSLMTVSAVLNGKASERRISVGTQDRVREIAHELQYRPNAIARSLRRQSTNVIGVYSGLGYLNARNHFISELIGGLQEGCDQHHKDLLLHGTFHERPTDEIYLELLDGRLDGLIVHAAPADPVVERLAASELPVVAVADAIAAAPSVVVDDADGMRQVVAHLAARGHHSIAYLRRQTPSVSDTRRCRAAHDAGARHGMVVRDAEEIGCTPANSFPLAEWLQEPTGSRPTAVVAWADSAAHQVIAYCRDRDIRIPDDVAVTGFDGFDLPAAAPKRLTTIRAPWSEVGRMAVATLVARMEGSTVPLETVLPVQFAAGDTS